MVSETVLRELDAAVRDAGNRRNQAQFEVNDFNIRVSDAAANVQRAQTQEQDATERNNQKLKQHRELLDYYNGLADKSGLESIASRIEALAAEQRETHRLVGEARQIRMRRNEELEEAKTQLAVAQNNLTETFKEWQRVSEQARKAREEQ